MLLSLEIQNYALIEKSRIEFSKGLTIITGETGAGKSILLGALGLIMGKRADTKVLYNSTKKCVVESTFDISSYKLHDYFAANELEYFDELTLRREISPNGKSRAFVNDSPVTLNVIQELSENLIDLHQQFDSLDLHKVSFQLRMLDALAGNTEMLLKYSECYHSYRNILKEIAQLEETIATQNKEFDFLNFQFSELENAKLVSGELEELESELQLLNSAEEIKRITTLAVNKLYESEYSVAESLRSLIKEFSTLGDVDNKFVDLSKRLEIVYEEIMDISSESADISENTEHRPEKIAEVQDRLNTLYRLLKKHQKESVEDLIQWRDELSRRLNRMGGLEGELQKLKSESNLLQNKLLELAKSLTESRKSVVPSFITKTEDMLRNLAMPNAKLEIKVEETDEFNATGKDKVTFLFAPNKGSEFLPIKDIASGGEISRLMLCMKSLVAAAIPLPTLIFDEIETGLSGNVAQKMGAILKKLASEHQVVSITHSPQIAAMADLHYYVYKEEQSDRTISHLKVLDQEERIYEIAKMLSGDPPSQTALANAKDLMVSRS